MQTFTWSCFLLEQCHLFLLCANLQVSAGVQAERSQSHTGWGRESGTFAAIQPSLCIHRGRQLVHSKLRPKTFKFAFCFMMHVYTHTHTQRSLSFSLSFQFLIFMVISPILFSFLNLYLLMCFQILYCHFSEHWGRSQVHTTKLNQKPTTSC